MSDSKVKLRIWVRPRLGGLYWTAFNPDEVIGEIDTHRYYRGLTREEAINKCIRAYTPKEFPWEEVIYERRRKLEKACWHELHRWYPPVAWYHRLWCKWFGHAWRHCWKHSLSQCNCCDYRVTWSEPK